jgi:hypothetical protein
MYRRVALVIWHGEVNTGFVQHRESFAMAVPRDDMHRGVALKIWRGEVDPGSV